MKKKAALNEDVELYPHQKRFVNRPGDTLIAAHSVGSGKTLSAIARFEKMKSEGKANKALVIVPAGLRENFARDGVGRFTDSRYNIVGNKQEIGKKIYSGISPDADYNVMSYEMFRANPKQALTDSGADLVISDESHRGKNEGTMTTDALKMIKGENKKYIGLTGSIISNSIGDVVPLIDVASGGAHSLGDSKKEFSERFLKRNNSSKYKDVLPARRPVIGFNHKNELEGELMKYIDYVDYDDVKDIAEMPNKDVRIIKVPITADQERLYKKLLKNNPAVMKMITQKRIETMKDEESAKAFSTLIESRKLMNDISTTDGRISPTESARMTPKTRRMLDDLQKHLNSTPDGQAILFSHLISGGTDVVEAGLKDRHIQYGRFLGKGNKGVTEASRQQDVVDYNARKNRVMVVSSAGGEGLSMGNTTWEGVLDPHYNPEKMNQLEARGIRSGGLAHRDKKDRSVIVNRYLATMPKTLGIFPSKYKTPDEFIYEIASNKDKQNQLFLKLLKDKQRREYGGYDMNKTAGVMKYIEKLSAVSPEMIDDMLEHGPKFIKDNIDNAWNSVSRYANNVVGNGTPDDVTMARAGTVLVPLALAPYSAPIIFQQLQKKDKVGIKKRNKDLKFVTMRPSIHDKIMENAGLSTQEFLKYTAQDALATSVLGSIGLGIGAVTAPSASRAFKRMALRSTPPGSRSPLKGIAPLGVMGYVALPSILGAGLASKIVDATNTEYNEKYEFGAKKYIRDEFPNASDSDVESIYQVIRREGYYPKKKNKE